MLEVFIMSQKYVKLRSKERNYSSTREELKGLSQDEIKKLNAARQAEMRERSYSTSADRLAAKQASRKQKAQAQASRIADEEAAAAARAAVAEQAKARAAAAEQEKARAAADKKAKAQAKTEAEAKAKAEAEAEAEAKAKAEEEKANPQEKKEGFWSIVFSKRYYVEGDENQKEGEVYSRLKRLTPAEVIRAAKIAGNGADEAIVVCRDLDVQIDAKNEEIKNAKTPKDADDKLRQEFNDKRAAMRKERAALERSRMVAASKALSLEKIGDEYTLVARYLTKNDDLLFRKQDRIEPIDPNLSEKALPLFARLEVESRKTHQADTEEVNYAVSSRKNAVKLNHFMHSLKGKKK